MTGTIIRNPNAMVEAFYTISINLANNVDPLENTNYERNDEGVIILKIPHYEYINNVSLMEKFNGLLH